MLINYIIDDWITLSRKFEHNVIYTRKRELSCYLHKYKSKQNFYIFIQISL
jgi:hypothetical protein